MSSNSAGWYEGPTWRDEEDSVKTELFRTRRRRVRNLVFGGAVGAAYVFVVALTVTVVHVVAAVLP